MERANCRGKPTTVFFEGANKAHPYAEAKVLCAECPVNSDCLEWAMIDVNSREYGFYAGTTPADRTKLRLARNMVKKTHCVHHHELIGDNVEIVNSVRGKYKRCVTCRKTRDARRPKAATV